MATARRSYFARPDAWSTRGLAAHPVAARDRPAAERLRGYVRSLHLAYSEREPRPLLTADELAAVLELDPRACREALVELSCTDEIQVVIHPGGRCEMRPVLAAKGGPTYGHPNDPRHTPGPRRLLATLLFTDIVDSTERAAELGDRRWSELLERHRTLVRRELARFGGCEVDAAGDGFLAIFDGPTRGVRCARAVCDALRSLGLEMRAGLHTGECELMDGGVGGIAIHVGARVAASAAAGEVLVSSTVRDLAYGSGLPFRDRGVHRLKGIPGEWRLFAVESQERSGYERLLAEVPA
jgi:class 3 adenylate cyclase